MSDPPDVLTQELMAYLGLVPGEYWQRAASLLMAAAEGGDLEALAAQIERALLMDGALALGE